MLRLKLNHVSKRGPAQQVLYITLKWCGLCVSGEDTVVQLYTISIVKFVLCIHISNDNMPTTTLMEIHVTITCISKQNHKACNTMPCAQVVPRNKRVKVFHPKRTFCQNELIFCMMKLQVLCGIVSNIQEFLPSHFFTRVSKMVSFDHFRKRCIS